jgi:uncharacterized protein (TIGR00369 family)
MTQRFDGSMFGPDQPCFGCGPDHPFGFHLAFTRDGDDVVTRFAPNDRYQGALGIMHGGLVATLADEIGAWACIVMLGKFGFTTSFNMRFLRPVRIGKEIEARARIVKSTPRIVDVVVEATQESERCFTSELRFLILDKTGAEKMLGRELPPGWDAFAR